ncbi:Dynein light chain 4, axonemal [Perkinsus olseni]|uniref:Dynein light chain 4, axonemal n=1 Tax=Perkinsus olseni TaxID=32597 RepID=A0A7J6ULW6_PEROL|nr:Dynein light chain 4, axonemal [Perkinsus olseni]
MAAKDIPTDLKKQMQRSLVKHTDMVGDSGGEVVDLIVGAIDKHSTPDGVNMEAAARLIKDSLDKQYGITWHCVLGKGFSFDISAQVRASAGRSGSKASLAHHNRPSSVVGY